MSGGSLAVWLLGGVLLALAVAYHRGRALVWTGAAAGWLALGAAGGSLGTGPALVLWAIWGLLAVVLNATTARRALLVSPLLRSLTRVLPTVSETEREALNAGTTWWDAEIFGGTPDWRRLLEAPAPSLTPDEQAFLDGPVEELCRMLDDWRIVHELDGLPEEVWAFLRRHRFFGMIIPREYGGLGFSALAHSAVIVKIASRSDTAAIIVMVPNSLGPAELLLRYGTEEQRTHYLPRLARGDEIPCFALTGPSAGSDAAAVPDTGIVCRADRDGVSGVLGIRLNWDKRYITLAPVATLIGLAFKLRDPEHLLGEREDLGITVALVPAGSPGVNTGRRHRPMGMAFYNGPTTGTDVFVALDAIIGGPSHAGRGWAMLMDCLAAGRAISLPALATGSGKVASRTCGAYAVVRRQFNASIGQFEGVQEALARIGGNTYVMDAARTLTAAAVDLGEKPSVCSAIIKYHLTERMRRVLNDALDLHGGRGICRGPRNYLARGYLGIPVAITVEGANILTRSLIIFGQGAIRCHPYVRSEMEALADPDRERACGRFDDLLGAHLRFALANGARALVKGLLGPRFARPAASAPGGRTARFYAELERMSAAFAFTADVALLLMGGRLKRMERLSARLGDVLSQLYLASAALKRFEDQGRPESDLPLLQWGMFDCLWRAQRALDVLIDNFPTRWVRPLLRAVVFPTGRPYLPPGDGLGSRVAKLLQRPGQARDRLTHGIYVGGAGDPVGRVEHAMLKVLAARPASRKLRGAVRSGTVPDATGHTQIQAALEAGAITAAEAGLLREAELARDDAIQVDHFPAHEFGLARWSTPSENDPDATGAGGRRAARSEQGSPPRPADAPLTGEKV